MINKGANIRENFLLESTQPSCGALHWRAIRYMRSNQRPFMRSVQLNSLTQQLILFQCPARVSRRSLVSFDWMASRCRDNRWHVWSPSRRFITSERVASLAANRWHLEEETWAKIVNVQGKSWCLPYREMDMPIVHHNERRNQIRWVSIMTMNRWIQCTFVYKIFGKFHTSAWITPSTLRTGCGCTSPAMIWWCSWDDAVENV